MVRPWALSAPIAILLICLPLLRPLRHPAPSSISDSEQAILATVQAIVEQHTLAINETLYSGTHDVIIRSNWRVYSQQSPMMAVMLSGPYWLMHRWNIRLDHDPVLAEYLLTLIGVTLPVALAAGLLYRMGRLFELRRRYRAALALMVVVGSGWISYATVLNAEAAAAALVIAGAACLVQATLTKHRLIGLAWTLAAGVLVSLAATYEMTALVFLLLMAAVIVVFRWPLTPRLIGVGLYLLGAAAPLALYARLNHSVTGDFKPAFMHPELALDSPDLSDSDADDPPAADGSGAVVIAFEQFFSGVGRAVTALVGGHGALSHFPVLIMGVLGVTMVMHRHWPAMTKVLAAVTLAAAIVIIIAYAARPWQWKDPMFANRWFVVFMPLMLFWSGAWLRRSHRRSSWIWAGSLFAFSAIVALVGAANPLPPEGYDGYSAAGAVVQLIRPAKAPGQSGLLAKH
jgi:hypothetical protein